MREICHLQAGQCGNQIGAKVIYVNYILNAFIIILDVRTKTAEAPYALT